MAYAVTLSHIAAGPEVEFVIDPAERERQEQMAAEIARVHANLEAAEQLLSDAAKRETQYHELLRQLQEQLASLEGKEGDEKRIRELTVRIAVLELESEQERKKRQALEEEVEQLRAQLKERLRERVQELKERFRVTYAGKFVVDDYVIQWLAQLPDIERRYKAERAMLRLSDGKWQYLRDKPRIKATKTPIWEAEFDRTGRLYFIRESNILRFVRIGDKNSQDTDIRWIQKTFG